MAETALQAAAILSAAAQLKLLLTEVEAQQAILATPYDAWSDRLDGLQTPEDLIAALRDIEQELNVLGDGLPRGKPSLCFRSLLHIIDGIHMLDHWASP